MVAGLPRGRSSRLPLLLRLLLETKTKRKARARPTRARPTRRHSPALEVLRLLQRLSIKAKRGKPLCRVPRDNISSSGGTRPSARAITDNPPEPLAVRRWLPHTHLRPPQMSYHDNLNYQDTCMHAPPFLTIVGHIFMYGRRWHCICALPLLAFSACIAVVGHCCNMCVFTYPPLNMNSTPPCLHEPSSQHYMNLNTKHCTTPPPPNPQIAYK